LINNAGIADPSGTPVEKPALKDWEFGVRARSCFRVRKNEIGL